MINHIVLNANKGYLIGVLEQGEGKIVFGTKPIGLDWSHGLVPEASQEMNEHPFSVVLLDGFWKKVSVVIPVGYSCGIVEHNNGKLVLSVKSPDENWPEGFTPNPASTMVVEEGNTRFSVDDSDD